MITNQDPRRYRAAVARLACGVAPCRQHGNTFQVVIIDGQFTRYAQRRLTLDLRVR
jgi:hypothetical protein